MASHEIPPEFNMQRFSAQELARYSRLSEITRVINHGFGDAVSKNATVLKPRAQRFGSEQQLLSQLGADVVLFLMTVKAPDGELGPGEEEIVATASYKPYETTWSTRSEFDEETQKALAIGEKRNLTEADIPAVQKALGSFAQSDSHEDMFSVEVVAVATSPEWQGRGLATRLLERITEDVSAIARDSNTKEGAPSFRLMVRTVKEINEPFWSKRLFGTVESRFVEAGLSGSVKGFHMIEMSRHHTIK